MYAWAYKANEFAIRIYKSFKIRGSGVIEYFLVDPIKIRKQELVSDAS